MRASSFPPRRPSDHPVCALVHRPPTSSRVAWQIQENIRCRKKLAVAMVVLSLGVLPACATKKFVRAEVGSVNEKVDTLGTSLEETQERTRQSDARIGAVDVKAEAAARSAADAGTAAAAAGTAASAATTATKEVDTRLSGRVDGVETAARRLVYEVTLSEAEGNFTSGDSVLPDDAKLRLDQMVTKLMTDRRTWSSRSKVIPTTAARWTTTSGSVSREPTR